MFTILLALILSNGVHSARSPPPKCPGQCHIMPHAIISSFVSPHHYFLGWPLYVFPSVVICWTLYSRRCQHFPGPTRLSLPSLVFSFSGVTLSVSLRSIFLTWSFLFTPLIQLNIHISVQRNICSCLFFVAQHSANYIKTGQAPSLWIFPQYSAI